MTVKSEIRPGIYSVGATDWDVRNFHGYKTQRGSTYNAFLIVDEKIVLVDTVKADKCDRLLNNISRIVDPKKIDIVVSNHVEMDHSGALPQIMEIAPQATLMTSKNGIKGLRKHFKKEWNFQVVGSGDEISIGKRTLQFVNTPMLHWPDSMVTYIPEEKLLFSNDAFGQHVACGSRFDDESNLGLIYDEAAKYYANIVLPFGKQVNKALKSLAGLEIDCICPSHGVIWRKDAAGIIQKYQQWANHETEGKALIVYDTMWNSTKKLAKMLEFGLVDADVPVVSRNLSVNHVSDVMADVLSSRLILLGSPTLNNSIMPTMGGFLTYLGGLKPEKRLGFAFGSYGWGGQSVKKLEEAMTGLGWEQPQAGKKVEYIPDEPDLSDFRRIGEELGKLVRD